MVFGLLLSVARLVSVSLYSYYFTITVQGSTVNMNILAPIYEGTADAIPVPHQRLAFTLWIGMLLSVASPFISILFISWPLSEAFLKFIHV